MFPTWLLYRVVCYALLFLVLTRKIQGSSNAEQNKNSDVNLLSTISHPVCSPSEERHELERAQLLRRLDRNVGKWDKKHPRWQILEALHGFDRYETIVGAEITRFEDLYKHIPKKHKKLLSSTINYSQNFQEARQQISINAKFCKQIVSFALQYYKISRHELETFIHDTDDGKPKPSLRTTVSQTLKHMVRDWSPAGQEERHTTFPYILEALSNNLPPKPGAFYKVLVPGAGLGRLPYEISRLGSYMEVTSNEWSASMNIAYRYLTSQSSSASGFTIHPYLESWSHARTRSDIFRSVQIHPPSSSNLPLLIEGDFTTLPLPQSQRFSAIVTLFFIDTARNLLSYLETIHSLLEEGGIWINFGPLLYGTAPLVQLSLEEIFVLAEEMGFVFEEKGEGEVLYNFNESTMYRHGYVGQRWVARKIETGKKGEGWGLGGW